MAVPGYIDPCPVLPCRARRILSAGCRPKFISVTAWRARFRECSTSSTSSTFVRTVINPLTARAVGLKPSASQDEARLRGQERNYRSTPINPRLCAAKPACTGYIVQPSTFTHLQPSPFRAQRRLCPGRLRSRAGWNGSRGEDPPQFWCHSRAR